MLKFSHQLVAAHRVTLNLKVMSPPGKKEERRFLESGIISLKEAQYMCEVGGRVGTREGERFESFLRVLTEEIHI